MNDWIVNHWRQLADRFASLQIREQTLIAVTGAVITIALCDFLFWSPMGAADSALRNQHAELQQQLQRLQLQHADISVQLKQDPDKPVQQQVEASRARIDALNQRMQALTVDLIRPDAMPTVLRDLVEQRRGLKLIALANQQAVIAFDKLGKVVDPKDKSNLVVIYKHGLSLTLKGSYFDILDYLKAVEGLPWHFFWERLEYNVKRYPEAEVTIHVYTLGDQEEWIGA